MSLMNLITNTGSGLAAQRAVSQTASHNIANVSTPGYARQRVNLDAARATTGAGGAKIGNGMLVNGVTQARDQFVEAQLPESLSAASYYGAESSVLTSVSQLAPELPTGIPVNLGAFYGSLRELSENPASIGHRTAFVESARGLAMSLRRAGEDIAANRQAVDVSVEAELPLINDLLEQVTELNVRIRVARAQSAGEPNDLLDQQQRAVDEISELVGGKPMRDGDGNMTIMLPSGEPLITATAAVRFVVQPDPANEGLNRIYVQPVDGGSPREVQFGDLGGKVGGMMDARDGALLETSDRLDQFAWELGNRINQIHRAGYGSNGDTGYDLFTMTTQNRAAREININQDLVEDPTLVGAAGSALVGSGDNTNVMAMLETENENVGGLGGPPRAVLGDTIGRYGSLAKRSLSTAEAETVARDYLIGMRDSASGVSVDEELIELTKAQRAFEAMSKVADTTNQMLETILNLR